LAIVAELVMPILGADMEAGVLVAWRCRPGDRVRRGDIVAEVETEKGLIEIEAYASGVVEKLLVAPGTKVPVGTPLAVIDGGGGAETTSPVLAAPAPGASPPVAAATVPVAATVTRPRVSPAARRRAGELGVGLERIAGTGPEGAVTVADVERTATSTPSAPEPSALRRAIAAAMSRSKREIPHFYLATTIDLRAATTWLAETNHTRPVGDRLLLGLLYVKAVALALREVPELNAVWSEDRPVPRDAIHVGVAIALRGGGLVAPALLDTDRRPLAELMAAFRDLVTRARAGRLKSSEIGASTITVTSLGDNGVETVFPVIYPPQVAIVGFGAVVQRPWCDGGTIVAAPVVTATLAADHRVTDGHRASALLAAVARRLAAPEAL
jgi:pyruvate dehydrogenase E2 component (dihydrolipoamide acetyltransferase)